MNKLVFSNISLITIKKYVDIETLTEESEVWLNLDSIKLKKQKLQEIKMIQSHLNNMPIHLMNEATIWGRAIYPLLLLAESQPIQAWADVPLQTSYKNFALEGIADAVIAKSVAGYLEAPYFIVVESKRGIEAKNPIPQLYAELLTAAKLNQQQEAKNSQQVFGCYTIADSWTFVQADIFKIESKRPLMKIKTSGEYAEKYEAINILKILNNILKKTVKI